MKKFESVPIGHLLQGQLMEGGQNKTWFSIILTDSRHAAIVKLLPTRKILIELICATLGRAMGLPIPEVALVQILPSTSLEQVNISESTFALASIDAKYPSFGTFTQDREIAPLMLSKNGVI